MAYDNAIYDKGSSLKKLETEETELRAKLNVATRTEEQKAEIQKPSVYAESEYHGPPVMGVEGKVHKEPESQHPTPPAMTPSPGAAMPLDTKFYANSPTSWRKGDESFVELEAKKVTLPGYEDYDFYLHHPVPEKGKKVDKDVWMVSEGHTGMSLGVEESRADDAIKAAAKRIAKNANHEQLDNIIKRGITDHGESPIYKKLETEPLTVEGEPAKNKSKFSDFVSNELAHDEAYQNALKHSDPQNIEVELQAAIKRAKGKEVLAKLAESQGSQPSAAAKAEEPTHPFIGLYKGKQYESHAVSLYAAQKEIAKRVGARHEYDVSVYAATETEPLAAAIEHEKDVTGRDAIY